MRTLPFIALVLSLALHAAGARAQDGFELGRFRPAPTPEDGLALVLPRTLGHLRPGFALTLDYAHKPLLVTEPGRRDETVLVEHRLLGHVNAALGLGSRFELFVRAPALFLQRGDTPSAEGTPALPTGAAFGSVHAGASLRLLGQDDGPLQLGVTGWAEVPSGDRPSLMGDRAIGAGGLLSGSAHTHAVSFAVNVGGRYRPDATYGTAQVGPELLLGAGVYAYAGTYVTFLGELSGAIGMRHWGNVTGASAPLEALAGMRVGTPEGPVFTFAAGAGLTSAVGEPDVRGVFQVAFPSARPALVPPDTDGDGLRDDRDRCSTRVEDKDGFEDDDGCPDVDNDKDGLRDKQDRCPDAAEDRDGNEDGDGCPDLDNDKDGIEDGRDQCPNAVEDKDDFEDDDGCPDLDNDKDGLVDLRDQCRDNAEDQDGFADEDGCPDPDNDKDKVPDLDDQCPTVPGPASTKGCPSAVRIDQSQIRILQRIEFPTRGATIRSSSLVVLDQVYSVLDVNPQIRRVRIEGHTDDRGSSRGNARLSQKRAEAVMKYLVRRGLDPMRLEAKGWGEERPLVKNDSAENMQINRRVEFHIVDPAPPKGAPGTLP